MELKLEDILPLLGAKATSEAVLAQAVADLNTYKKTSEREVLVHASETIKTLIKLHDDAADDEKPAEKAAPKKRRTRKKASKTEVKEPEEKEDQPAPKAEAKTEPAQGTPTPQQPAPAPEKPFAPKAPTDPNGSLFGDTAPAGQAQPQQKRQDNPFASQANPFGAN